MGHRDAPPLRSLPRFFLPGTPSVGGATVVLPREELNKVRNVLRLRNGDEIAVLPDDGSLWVASVSGDSVVLVSQHFPETEPATRLTLALGLAKAETLEESVRMGTEIGAVAFVVFPAARSVARWEPGKVESKLARLRSIAREAAEVAYRMRLPSIKWSSGLDDVLSQPDTWVLSEVEGVVAPIPPMAGSPTLVIGPEGGWSPSESAQIGERAVGMGPRVFRVDTAVAAAAALALLR